VPHCGLLYRHGWYLHDGRVRDVLQWWTPGGTLLRIRPVVTLDPPASAPPLADHFPTAAIGGTPECPKAWVWDDPAPAPATGPAAPSTS
jgi:hypothetical protein